MTPCIEGPTKPIKGADHKRPVIHWQMAPGYAWAYSEEEGWKQVGPISKERAARAEYTFTLQWIRGATAAIFVIDDQEYAQPTRDTDAGKRRSAAKSSRSVITQEEVAEGVRQDKPVPRQGKQPSARPNKPLFLEPL